MFSITNSILFFRKLTVRHWFIVLHDFHRKITIKTENFKNDLNKAERDDHIYYLKTLRVMSYPYAKMPAKTSRYRPTARHLKNPLVLRTVCFVQIFLVFCIKVKLNPFLLYGENVYRGSKIQ